MAAKGFTLPQMFGQLTDLVTQGFSSPEDLLNIGSTGQPDTADPYGGSEEAFQRGQGDIYGEVLKATGDPMIAGQAASESASDALVQAMLTDLTPSPNKMKLDQAVNTVLPMYGQENFYEKTIDEVATAYGIDPNTLSREVERVKRQEEINQKTWWQGEDDIVDTRITEFEPTISQIDPRRAITDLLSEYPMSELENARSTASIFPQQPSVPQQTPEELRAAYLEAHPEEEESLLAAGGPGDLDIKGSMKYMIPPMAQAVVPGLLEATYPQKEMDFAVKQEQKDVSETDELVTDIQALTSPGTTTETDITKTEIAKSEGYLTGTVLDPESRTYSSVLNAINNRTFQFVEQQKEDSSYLYIDPANQNMYSVKDGSIQSLGQAQLDEVIGDDTRLYELNGNYFKYNKTFNEYRRAGVGQAATTTGLPSIAGADSLYAKSPSEQWDIIRAREMGEDAFNPVMWGARRHGFRPARGQFLLSGGIADGQLTPFHQWLPSMEGRDRSQDWQDLVTASQLASDPSGWASLEGGPADPRNLKLGVLGSLMQGSGAKTDILNMTATALGAGEGYTSEALRKHLSQLYDVYESQVGASGQPVGGFTAWMDERRKRLPVTPLD